MDEDHKPEPDVSKGEQVIRMAAVAGMIGFIVLVAAIGAYFFLQWAGQYVTRTAFAGSYVEVSEYSFNSYGIRIEFKSDANPIAVGLKTARLQGENPIDVRRQGDAVLLKLKVGFRADSSSELAEMWWRFDESTSELTWCTKRERGADKDACAAFAAQMP